MTASTALIELLARLGDELDFDVARNVDNGASTIDVVWLDRSLPLAASPLDPIDLADAPVLPVVAFVARDTAAIEDAIDALASNLEQSGAPLRIIVIARESQTAVLAPVLESVEQLRKVDAAGALRERIADVLRSRPPSAGRTIVMSQAQLVEWSRRLREARPRSYSAESLFNRTGAID